MYFHLSILNLGVQFQFQSLLQNIYYINLFSLFRPEAHEVVKTPHDSPGYNPT